MSYDVFMSMGSGCLAAYGELETGYKDDLTLEEAKELAIKAIKAGIKYDLGSGSNVDVCIMSKGKKEYFRNLEIVGKREVIKPTPYTFKRNNIGGLKRGVEDFGESCEEREEG